MSLYPQSMDGGEAGKLTMEDGSGTLLESGGGLLLLAKEGIRLESMTGIAVQGVSDIMALCGSGTSSLCVNGSVDMTGGLTGLGGSTYINYAPYADAPEEGEFDWDGFTRNLAIGLGVVAVCVIGAAISIATLGAGSIVAGAFIGAGIGAISATVAGAAGDYSSGNVRSTEEAIRDVAISAISGAITGAVGVKFPGMNRLVEGGVDTTVAIAERAAYAALDGDMTLKEKLAYIFDPGQMVVDFLTGVFIGKMLDGMMAGVQNKLRSIFANNDAAMREALGIGDNSIKGGTPTSRPTWRQSELDAATDFPDYDAQKSFINGEEVPYGTKGSVRPDYYKDGFSVDIKNYNVESASGRSNLARNIEKQYYQRIENLPDGTKQSVMIDIRGQNGSDEALGALYDDIMQRTNNGVEILFKMD